MKKNDLNNCISVEYTCNYLFTRKYKFKGIEYRTLKTILNKFYFNFSTFDIFLL